MAMPPPPSSSTIDKSNAIYDKSVMAPVFEFGDGISASASIVTVVGGPSISIDDPSAQGNTMVTERDENDVDEQILEALRSPKDRLFVLKIGDSMESLIADSQLRTRAEMPPCSSSYHRLLVHRCATYYKLNPETDPATKIISVSITAESRKPPKRLIDLVEMPSITGPSFQIMRRGVARSTASSEAPDGSDVDPSETGSTQSSAKFGKRLTITERKAAYNEARSRIFMGFEEKSSSTSSLSLSAAGRRSGGSSIVSASASASNSSSGEDGDNDNASTAPTESEQSYHPPPKQRFGSANGRKHQNGSQPRFSRAHTPEVEPEKPGPGVDPQTGLFIPALYDPSLAHQHPYGHHPHPISQNPEVQQSNPAPVSPNAYIPPPVVFPYAYAYPYPPPHYPPYGYYYPPPLPPPLPISADNQSTDASHMDESQPPQPYPYGYMWPIPPPPPEGGEYPHPPPFSDWTYHLPGPHPPPSNSGIQQPPSHPHHPQYPQSAPPPGIHACPPQPLNHQRPPSSTSSPSFEHIHRPSLPRRGGGSSGSSGGLAMGPRSNSGSTTGRRSRGSGMRDDVSVTSSSSSSSRRAPPSVVSTQSPHPLPARPDWAVGLTPQKDHRERERERERERQRERIDAGEFPPLPQTAPVDRKPLPNDSGNAWGKGSALTMNSGPVSAPMQGEQPQYLYPMPPPAQPYGFYPPPPQNALHPQYFPPPIPPNSMGSRQSVNRLDDYDREFERPRGRGELYNPKAKSPNMSSSPSITTPSSKSGSPVGRDSDGTKIKALADSVKGLSLGNKANTTGVV